MEIINRTTMFFVMIIFGITQGMQPILGYNFGAANWPSERHSQKGNYTCHGRGKYRMSATELFPDDQ